MTVGQQALWAQMQEMGYSHGLCITALQILSQSNHAVSEMLAYIDERHPTEDEFIAEIAKICAS